MNKGLLLFLIVLFVAFYFDSNNTQICKKVYNFVTLFDEDKIVDNFRNVNRWGIKYNSTQDSNFSKKSYLLRDIDNNYLPEYFTFDNKSYQFDEWLTKYWTTGLMVLKVNNITKGQVVYEKYFLGNNADSKTISWSMGKSIVSALVGIAIDQQKIKSVKQQVKEFLPDFNGTAYGDITIEKLLTMTSGIDFNENYFDFTSDINRLGIYMIFDKSMASFLKNLKSDHEQGTKFKYISSDTQMLGLVLRAAVNTSLMTYFRENLWDNEFGYVGWLMSGNEEIAFGSFFAKLEFYASFGWLYLNRGLSPVDGRRILSESWVNDSTIMQWTGENKMGYGYQWWVPGNDYMAIGVYNQFIYVSPKHNIVIAKSSANPNYDDNPIESELIALAAFRKLADYFGTP